jgi:hypothetical protein
LLRDTEIPLTSLPESSGFDPLSYTYFSYGYHLLYAKER